MILVSAVIASCNLFDTRDPLSPSTDNQTLPLASTHEILFSNFRQSFEEKNIQEYEKLFSDTATHSHKFIFVPNQSAGTRYAAVFASWNKTSETEYFRNTVGAVNTSSSFVFQFLAAPTIVSFQSDSVRYTFNYTLFVPHTRSDIKIQQFTGRAEIVMSPDKNIVWRIYRWNDFETKKDSSWSDLKGQFAK